MPSEIFQENNGGYQYGLRSINQQVLVVANWISECSVIPYSRSRNRPIDKELALDLIAQENTSDLMINSLDLLFGDRYAANLLQDVIRNAQLILEKHPSILISHRGMCQPKQTSPAVSTKRKARRNFLDPVIDQAIEQAGSKELQEVYLKLKELALSSEPPFTGEIDGNGLCYTDDNDQRAILNKESLRKRLLRR